LGGSRRKRVAIQFVGKEGKNDVIKRKMVVEQSTKYVGKIISVKF
jgi:hypothetical protein